MNRSQAEGIYTLFHSRGWNAFLANKTDRLQELHRQLETCPPEKVAFLQGRIAEIRDDFDLNQKVDDMMSRRSG